MPPRRSDTLTPGELAKARKRAAEIRKVLPKLGPRQRADLQAELARHQDTINRYAFKPSAASAKAAKEAASLETQAKALRARANTAEAKKSGFSAEYAKGAAELEKKAAAARKRAQKGAAPPRPKTAGLAGQGPIRPGETRQAGTYTGATPQPGGTASAPGPKTAPPGPVGPSAPTGPGGGSTGAGGGLATAGGTTAGGVAATEAPGSPADPVAIDALARQQYAGMEWVLDDPELGPLVRQAAAEGWDPARLRGGLFKTNWFRTRGTHKVATAIKEYADDYLVPMDDKSRQNFAVKIITGELQPTEMNAWVKEQSKAMFPHLAAAIDRGISVQTYAAPYKAIAAQTLELAPEQINLNDTKWRRALDGDIDPKTNERRPMSLTDWEKTLKSSSEYGWDFTKSARSEASQFASKLAESFGVIG